MSNRRRFLQSALGVAGAAFAVPALDAAVQNTVQHAEHAATSTPVPVITPDVGDLAYTLDNGVKVFHLVAEPVKQIVVPGRTLDLWGFNGSAPGPTIQVTRGDRVRIVFDNHLPEPTSIHWHGFEDPLRFDGVPGISAPVVKPGEQYTYEFNIHQEGTYFYHSHMAMQEMVGMLGGFIMHPQHALTPRVVRDFLIHLQEYEVLPNNTVPNSMSMEYNWLVMNGKAGPATTPLIVREGERVRVRFVNLGMDHHPMHLHGYSFTVTGTEAGRIQPSAWWPGNTVLVGVAQARDVEFVASRSGDWMLHCHLPHHMMNQMTTIAGPLSRDPQRNMPPMPGMMMPEMKKPEMKMDAMPGMVMPRHDERAQPPGTESTQKDAHAEIAPDANSVKLYPQDALMESPMMAMDAAVDKPENYGLAAGWSGFMQGMMTLVRVLPDAQYREMTGRMRAANRVNDPYTAQLKEVQG